MSPESWALSLGKYLELRFHGGAYKPRATAALTCTHSLHHEHYQYFACNDLVASFKYASVHSWGVSLPPPLLETRYLAAQRVAAVEDIKRLSMAGHDVYSAVLEALCALANQLEGAAALKQVHKVEHAALKTCIEEAQLKLVAPSLRVLPKDGTPIDKDAVAALWALEDAVVHLKAHVAAAVVRWNARIQDAVGAKRKDKSPAPARTSGLPDSGSERGLEVDPGTAVPVVADEAHPVLTTPPAVDAGATGSRPGSLASDASEPGTEPVAKPGFEPGFEAEAPHQTVLPKEPELVHETVLVQELVTPRAEAVSVDEPPVATTEPVAALEWVSTLELVAAPEPVSEQELCDPFETLIPAVTSASVISTEPVAAVELVMAGKISLAPDLSAVRELMAGTDATAVTEAMAGKYATAGTDTTVETDATTETEETTGTDATAGTDACLAAEASSVAGDADAENKRSPAVSSPDTTSQEGKQSPAPPDRKSVKTIIMSQLRPPQPAFSPLQSPLPSEEHHLPTAGSLAPIPVLDNEPSSLIAHALASVEYRRALAELGATKAASASASPLSKRRSGPSPLTDKQDSASELTQSAESRKSAVLSFLRGSASAGSSPARSGGEEEPTSPPLPSQPATTAEAEPQGAEPRDPRTRSTPAPGLHVEVSLGGSGGAALSCRVYFAQAFAALRHLVVPQGEEAFARSLARCFHWAARGGRSGSAFCKTRDDRFVLKEMPRAELQVFLDFAPHYFAHVMRCHGGAEPTLLAKIVGVFRVSLRGAASAPPYKATLLVMENLFYEREVTHKFDLKGSVRNRLVDPAEHAAGDVVLLDENLIKMACDHPLYVAAHAESVLSRAIDNDTRFLAAQDVMDYSLLVGLDSERRQLVVGIIDYIRTFTWDKRLETMVKSSGILGGQGKMPTVVSPELYRARFVASMRQYFLPVPDRWTGLGSELD